MLEKRLDALKGLVHPASDDAVLIRYLPSDRWAPFVEHYWVVRWHVADGISTVSELTYPSVQVVVECDESRAASHVIGVITGKFTKHLEGQGHSLGIKFRPGGFYPLVRSPAAAFTDRRVPLGEVFETEASHLERSVVEAPDDTSVLQLAEDFLSSIGPALDARMALVNEITGWISNNRTVTRVDHIATRFNIERRTLQRLFRRYVGVPPKWVIQRYRLLDAVEELAAHRDGDVGRLAADLGYFDQSHFSKDFKTTIGCSPAGYARRRRGAGLAPGGVP